MEKVSFFEVLFSFLLWLVIYFSTNSLYKKRIHNRSTSYFNYIFFSIIFCTFAYYVGDFPHYAILYEECLISSTPIHVEPIYFWLIKNMPSSYLLWRFVVWGAAIIIWIMVYKRMKMPAKYSCIIMTLILLYYFSAPRQSLAFAIMFYSLSFLYYGIKNKNRSYIIVCLGIYFACFFHKSMIMYVMLLLLALIPLKRTFFISSAIAFPFLYGVVLLYSSYLVEILFADSVGVDIGMSYLESEAQGGLTAWGWIQFAVTRIPIFYSIVYCVWLIYFKKQQVPEIFKVLIKYAYICMYIGLLFFQQQTSSFLSPRFLDATYYPLAIVMVYCLIEEFKFKKIRTILYMFLISNIYLFAYTLYKI